MPVKPFAIAASVILTGTILFSFLAIDPLKRAWWDYLNEHASEYYVHQMLTFNARIDLNLPTGSVLFYGDSMVQGLAAADMAVNSGIGHAGKPGQIYFLIESDSISSQTGIALHAATLTFIKILKINTLKFRHK